jgi:1,4-alpha-glucan branching enzyme
MDEAHKLAIYIIFDIVLHHAGDVFEYVVTEGGKTLKGIATDVVEGGLQPVHNILIRSYQYIIAKFDVDGYRIGTLKFLSPEFERIFGNAMREFRAQPGKKNFFTVGRCSTTRIRSRSSSAVMMLALASHADAGRSQRHVHSSALCVRRCQRPC